MVNVRLRTGKTGTSRSGPRCYLRGPIAGGHAAPPSSGRRKGAADVESAAAAAECLDRPAGLGDDVLHDRETEPGAARRAGAVGAVEALEDPPELSLCDSPSPPPAPAAAPPPRAGEGG